MNSFIKFTIVWTVSATIITSLLQSFIKKARRDTILVCNDFWDERYSVLRWNIGLSTVLLRVNLPPYLGTNMKQSCLPYIYIVSTSFFTLFLIRHFFSFRQVDLVPSFVQFRDRDSHYCSENRWTYLIFVEKFNLFERSSCHICALIRPAIFAELWEKA